MDAEGCSGDQALESHVNVRQMVWHWSRSIDYKQGVFPHHPGQ